MPKGELKQYEPHELSGERLAVYKFASEDIGKLYGRKWHSRAWYKLRDQACYGIPCPEEETGGFVPGRHYCFLTAEQLARAVSTSCEPLDPSDLECLSQCLWQWDVPVEACIVTPHQVLVDLWAVK